MSQLFINDSMLQLKLDTGISLVGATSMKILYVDPEGVEGEFTVSSTDGTKLVYNVAEGDITVPGKWRMQAKVEIAGNIGYGAIAIIPFTATLNTEEL